MKRKFMEANTKETPAVDDNNKDEEEEEEEEKVNAFFNLVRNIREAHNQILIGSQDSKQKQKAKGTEIKSTWTPSFKWEDFAQNSHLTNNVVVTLPTSSKIEQEQKGKTEEHQGLDLNLSL
ncbi:hypothetical protein PTKIN_Ptkin12aG0149200 [Pterospermum kingtungense]